MSKAEWTYLKRGLKKFRGKMARFYMTAKVHKCPVKYRPIVATCGTALSALSKWLDYKLKQLVPFIDTYIKDSNDFRAKLNALGVLPKNAKIFTADARSMYTNICTAHALKILRDWLEELKIDGKLPPDFDIDMIIEAAQIVMSWNIFEFGNCYFKQLVGTAMGTAAACLWAIIYYFWHKKHVLLPRYSSKMPLMVRYIDDLFGVALIGDKTGMTETEWSNFKHDMNNFGIQNCSCRV